MEKWLRGTDRVKVNQNGALVVDNWLTLGRNYPDYIWAIAEEKLKRELRVLIVEDKLKDMLNSDDANIIENLYRSVEVSTDSESWYQNMQLQLMLEQAKKHADKILNGTQKEFEDYYGAWFDEIIRETYIWALSEIIKLYDDIWQKDSVRYAEAIDTANGLLDVDYNSIGYIRCFDDIESAIKDIEANFGQMGEGVLDYFFENDIYLHNLKGGKVLVVKYNENK